jgi:hypothetical protein
VGGQSITEYGENDADYWKKNKKEHCSYIHALDANLTRGTREHGCNEELLE